MKRLLLAVFVGILIVGSVAVASAAAPSVRANIPFAFHAGDALLPAGEYTITVGGHPTLGYTIVIEARDGRETYFVPFTPGESTYKDSNYRLTFTKYGDAYFMSKVQVGVTEVTTSKSLAERKMAGLQGKKLPVVASLTK
jgi:hypothetical protein